MEQYNLDTDEFNESIFMGLSRTFDQSAVGQEERDCLAKVIIPRLVMFITPRVAAILHGAKKIPQKCLKECKDIYAEMYAEMGLDLLWDKTIFQVIVCVLILILDNHKAFVSVKHDKDTFLNEYSSFIKLGDPSELQKLFHYRNFMALALKVVNPLKNKKHLMQLIHKMTRTHSDKENLVSGGGQSDFINRRERIYLNESDLVKPSRAPREKEIQNYLQRTLFAPKTVAKVDSIAEAEKGIAAIMAVVDMMSDEEEAPAPLNPLSSRTCHLLCGEGLSVTSVVLPPVPDEDVCLDDDIIDYLIKNPVDWLTTEGPVDRPPTNPKKRKIESTHALGFLSKGDDIVYSSYERVTTTTFNSETDRCIDEFDLIESTQEESIPANFGQLLKKKSRTATTGPNGDIVIRETNSMTMFPDGRSLSAEGRPPVENPMDVVRVCSSNPQVAKLFSSSFQKTSDMWREDSVVKRMQSACGNGPMVADGLDEVDDAGMYLDDLCEELLQGTIKDGIAAHKENKYMDIDPLVQNSLNNKPK